MFYLYRCGSPFTTALDWRTCVLDDLQIRENQRNGNFSANHVYLYYFWVFIPLSAAVPCTRNSADPPWQQTRGSLQGPSGSSLPVPTPSADLMKSLRTGSDRRYWDSPTATSLASQKCLMEEQTFPLDLQTFSKILNPNPIKSGERLPIQF